MPKSRLDQLLVARGLAENRTRAQALIMAGLVYSGERKLDKAGVEFTDDVELIVRGREHPWVSRGGMKLAHAFAQFPLDVKGKIAMDVGSSTGGFTDVLLHHGAAKVYAVDVGTGQLDVKLRGDSRVVVMEQTNARHLTTEMFHSPLEGESNRFLSDSVGGNAVPEPPPPNPKADWAPPQGGSKMCLDFIVCDASFISLKKVLPAALALAKPGGTLVTLIKPQFEVGKAEVSRGKGVIRDPALHQAVCDDIAAWIDTQGWQVHGLTPSPITGPKGNVEFLMYATKQSSEHVLS